MTKPRGIIALILTKPRGIIALFLTKPRGIMPCFWQNREEYVRFRQLTPTPATQPRFYYFCVMNLNDATTILWWQCVVICFDFIIFALWISTESWFILLPQWLWFASILLFLHYESQLEPRSFPDGASCDLLRFYYFCIMNPNTREYIDEGEIVVICFDFIIFALWIPTNWNQ